MDNSILEDFMTPHNRSIRQFSINKNNTTRLSSKYKRIPIFANTNTNSTKYHIDRKSQRRNSLFGSCCNPSQAYTQLYEQNLTELQVINFDFCGCEDKLVPCQTIMQSFLSNVHVNNMKRQYMEEMNKNSDKINKIDKKRLFTILPYNYPEVYVTHLNNLVQVLEIRSENQFQCLLSIQYHSKIEYITYFLYQDMKRSYNNKERFLAELDCQLIRYDTSFGKLGYVYNLKYLAESLDVFVNDYFQSVGANLIPITYYSKFMAAIYKKGPRYMVHILARFMVQRRRQLEEGLMYLRCAQLEKYRKFMRTLNFQQLIVPTQ